MKTGKWHAGVTTRQVPLGDGGGPTAAIVTTGLVAVLLLGIPAFWVFPAGAVALGIAFAIWVSYRGLGSVPLSLNAAHAGAPHTRWKRLVKFLQYAAAAIAVGFVAKIVLLHPGPGAHALEKETDIFHRPVLFGEWLHEWPSFKWEAPLIWWFLGCSVLFGIALAAILKMAPRSSRIMSLSWTAENRNTEE